MRRKNQIDVDMQDVINVDHPDECGRCGSNVSSVAGLLLPFPYDFFESDNDCHCA